MQAFKINTNKMKTFTIVRSRDYNVSSRNSSTLQNEKDALERISEQISEDILERLLLELNDN